MNGPLPTVTATARISIITPCATEAATLLEYDKIAAVVFREKIDGGTDPRYASADDNHGSLQVAIRSDSVSRACPQSEGWTIGSLTTCYPETPVATACPHPY